MMKSILTFFALQLLAVSVWAQADRNLAAQIQAVRNQTYNAAQTFLNPSIDAATRVKAIEPFSGLYDRKQIDAAKKIVQNAGERPAVRAMALEKLVDEVTSDETLWNTTIAWVKSPSTPREMRDAALDIFKALAFSPFTMFDKSQEVMSTLRSLVTDKNKEYRTFALNYLSAHGDSYTQDLLIKQLKGRKSDLVPVADAVGILALNPHGDYLPAVNEVFQNPPDEATEIQALSVLGSYGPAKQKIKKILNDKKKPGKMRHMALANLLANYPSEADDLSYNVISNPQEADDLKAEAIGQLYFKRKSNKQKHNRKKADKLDNAIKNTLHTTKSKDLQQLISWYIDEVNPSY